MFRSYLLVALRNLRRTKVLSSITILGLAVGMTASLLILHYVTFERSFDKFHAGSDRIYRLRYERTDDSGESVRFASCCPPAGARIRGQYPQVENIARAFKYEASVSRGDEKFLENRMFFVEPEFLEILKFEFVEGDPSTGISEPNHAFISQSTAQKYFGDEDPIGQTLSIDKKTDYQITGIFKDCPKNSHIKFDFLLPWENMAAKMGPEYTEAWGHTGVYTYLIMEPGTDPIAFEKSLQPMINAECPWLAEYNMTIDLRMQPLTDIHLNSHFMQEYEPNGDRESVDILALIALFIMIMAWVNFVNLATACSVSRAREVGMRKVVGATRRQIVVQHFFEFGVTNLIAASCAVILVALFQPVFNSLTGMPDNIGLFSRAWFVGALGVMVFVGVFLSGLYPVLAMASFKPASVLKGKWGNSSVGIRLRKALVVFQFAVGLVLVMATITVFGQVSFMRSQTLGFNMDQTMVIKAPRVRNKESYGTDIETLKETLMSFPEINRVCHVTEVPGRQIYWDAGGIHKAGEDISQSKNYQIVGIDYDFADAFELEFAAGRNFSVEFPTDKEALILNETAVQWMGFEGADSAVGQQVEYWGEIYTIVGVLKDYHQQSLKVDVEPHIFRLMPYGRGTMGMIAVKTNVQDVQATIASVRGQYDKMFPGNPFEYFFLDDYYHQQYESDERFGRVYSLFSLLAIVIIVLGIYGLSAFSITRMTKAIGIRKVLGASVSSITGMLTREFVILGAIANIVAWPVAYYSLSRWLENFAYRTEIGLGVFLLAGFTVMVVALGTVSMQVIRAARTNPVDAIREE